MRKLYRSKSSRKILGVLGGIAQYFGIDATVLRLGYVLLSLFTTGFPGIIIYLVAALIIPEEPDNMNNYQQN